MSTTAKVAVSGIIGAVVGAGILYFVMSEKANDDDPIIMAGGSLHVYDHGKKFKNKKGTAVHADSSKYVTEVDIIGGDPLTFTSTPFNNQSVQIKMPYCKDAACASIDNVYIQTVTLGQGLTMSDDDNTIGAEADGTTEVVHQPDTGHLQKVTVNGTDYSCSNGHCYLIIHYCNKADCS